MRGIVGWSNTVAEPAFGGGGGGSESVKNRLIGLMTSVRTLMRSRFSILLLVLRGPSGRQRREGTSCWGRRFSLKEMLNSCSTINRDQRDDYPV